MISHKLSSATKRLLAEASETEAIRRVDLLVRVATPVPADFEATIRDLDCHIRTQAGDVWSMSAPIRSVDALAQLEPVQYVEVAEPLHPEGSARKTGE